MEGNCLSSSARRRVTGCETSAMAADVRPPGTIAGPQSTGALLQNLLQEALGQPAGAQRIRGGGRDELLSSTAVFKVLVRGCLGALDVSRECKPSICREEAIEGGLIAPPAPLPYASFAQASKLQRGLLCHLNCRPSMLLLKPVGEEESELIRSLVGPSNGQSSFGNREGETFAIWLFQRLLKTLVCLSRGRGADSEAEKEREAAKKATEDTCAGVIRLLADLAKDDGVAVARHLQRKLLDLLDRKSKKSASRAMFWAHHSVRCI
jgi:hypothetical protein